MRFLIILTIISLGILQCIADEPEEKESIEAVKKTRPIVNEENFNGSKYLKRLKLAKTKQSTKGDGKKENDTKPGKMGINLHIINGWQAQRGMFPWQASITLDQSSFCGGSLITAMHVLSAAHCVERVRVLLVTLGAQNVNAREQGRVVLQTRRKLAHPEWNDRTLKNDISIIFLPRKVFANPFVNTVRLPSRDDDTLEYSGQLGVVSGWGKTSDRSRFVSKTLFYTDVAVVDSPECEDLYGADSFHDTNICALGDRNRATCQGDSGGPLVIRDTDGDWTQIGVVSYGAAVGCGKGFPDVFTRVSSYVDWISSRTGTFVRRFRRN